MFNSTFRISGKHANYLKDLCELQANVPDRDQHTNFKVFNAYIDAYILCPLIGYQYNRKAVIDNNVPGGDAGIMADMILKRQKELKFVYQIIMFADEESEPDSEKRIYRATTFSEETEENKEMIKKNMKIYNSYFLGGLEIMHEQFVEQCITDDDYLKKIFDFVRHFEEEQNGEELKASIDRILNK